MAINQLNPYLNFNGDAAKAIALYERALGAKVENKMGFGDMPGAEPKPETKDRIMHAVLRIGPTALMLSDSMPSDPVTPGTNAHVCLDFSDPDELVKSFEALSVGGKVRMPPQDTFWGAKFGMLVDAHGISWMFSCEKKKG